MNHRLLVIVGILSAALFLIDCFSLTSAHINARINYQKISDYLAEKGTHDASGYLELARQKLKSKKGWLSSASPYVKDLSNLVKLGKILAGPTCEYSEFKKLQRVAELAGGHEYVEDLETLSPVELIVYTAGYLRAQQCRFEHLRKFNEAYAQLDINTKERVEFMRNHIRRSGHMDAQDYVNHLEAYNPFEGEDWEIAVQASVDRLRDLSPHDRDGCNFDQMYSKYFERPCERYEQILGLPVLLPAHFDNQIFGGRVSYTEEEVPLYQAITHFRICKNMDSGSFRRNACSNWLQNKPANCEYVNTCVH